MSEICKRRLLGQWFEKNHGKEEIFWYTDVGFWVGCFIPRFFCGNCPELFDSNQKSH